MNKNIGISVQASSQSPTPVCSECSEVIEAEEWYYAIGKHAVCRECLPHFARRIFRCFRRRNGGSCR